MVDMIESGVSRIAFYNRAYNEPLHRSAMRPIAETERFGPFLAFVSFLVFQSPQAYS